jgi:DNA-binding NarL/FixJ family response regulator
MMTNDPGSFSANGRPRILFLDDHRIVLDALSFMAQDEYEVELVNTLAALNAAVERFNPSLVVMDICMPDGDGVEAAGELRRRHPEVKILFLSMHNESQLVRRALDTGALGYVSKRAPADELMLAVRTVLNGGKYVGAFGSSDGQDGDGVLTERQREVLRLIAQGCSAKEIAEKLNISVRTAEFHRAAIMDRLKLHSTAMMTRYVVQQGLD